MSPSTTGIVPGFLSTPSGWRATRAAQIVHSARIVISIHALRVEGDQGGKRPVLNLLDFYPRPPGGGRRVQRKSSIPHGLLFLSTPSGWRATRVESALSSIFWISIHALRVEGDGTLVVYNKVRTISIHALRVEGDREQLAHAVRH